MKYNIYAGNINVLLFTDNRQILLSVNLLFGKKCFQPETFF